MEFSIRRPDVVRAVNQRWLLNFWQSHRGAHRVPPWQSVVVEKLSGQSANLSMVAVSGDGDTARFQIRFNGTAIGQAYGASDHRGKYIDEIIPPILRPEGLPPFTQAARDGCPVYTIHDLKDRNGRVVHYERLLLPFAGDGRKVDRVLGSTEFVCLDGAFDGHNIMHVQTAPPVRRLAVRIEV
ncbi:PAS domain-containing protein [Microbacteriaceae bacterium K1510]|nr:PAS domain-containing protein [Microbacteriaceae bacterium K1510]